MFLFINIESLIYLKMTAYILKKMTVFLNVSLKSNYLAQNVDVYTKVKIKIVLWFSILCKRI